MSKRSVAQRLILFTREQITPLLGKRPRCASCRCTSAGWT